MSKTWSELNWTPSREAKFETGHIWTPSRKREGKGRDEGKRRRKDDKDVERMKFKGKEWEEKAKEGE